MDTGALDVSFPMETSTSVFVTSVDFRPTAMEREVATTTGPSTSSANVTTWHATFADVVDVNSTLLPPAAVLGSGVDNNNGSVNGSSALMMAPTFNEVSLMKAVVFGVMFVISLVGNTATLTQMYRLRRRKSTINTLIVNLAIADLLVTFFCIAGEAVWAATVQWVAGNVACKLVKYMQVFALYLSTYITIAISLDRCIAILDPMRRQGAAHRVRVMMLVAWGCSAIFSIPQAIVFHVLRGPFQEEFYQCVTFGSYKEEWQRQLYSVASLILMFVLPLVIIGTAYGLIFTTISRKSREVSVLDNSTGASNRRPWLVLWHSYRRACLCADGCDREFSREESLSSCSEQNGGRGPVRSNLLRRAKRKSLRMSVFIVLAFIVCWSPYYIIFTVCLTFLDWKEIDPKTLLWFSFIGLSNSMLNPIIYGAFQLCKILEERRLASLIAQSARLRRAGQRTSTYRAARAPARHTC
ncbi:gonadotropin-releasing hormone receptor-like [Babylonia areolata]|uniref:gonadotropin-releasing hormone receptor-like n=1 Tax=Babylonia areolata TaxID=304850 RepID=UPI003FD48BBD